MPKRPRDDAGNLSSEEAALWRDFVEDVSPLNSVKKVQPLSTKIEGTKNKITTGKALTAKNRPEPLGREIDGHTESRLKRGKIEIDGTLDLHGMTQAIAHDRLRAFIASSHSKGKRCVLVITGKGSSGGEDGEGRGVLKKRVLQWVDEPPLKNIVLKIVPAARHHGGGGAFYFYLRRVRDR